MRFMQNPIVQKVTFVLAVLFVVDLACTFLLGWRYPVKVKFVRQVVGIEPPPAIMVKPKRVEESEEGAVYLPSPDEFVRYDESPVPLNEVKHDYPPAAREAGIEGTVWIKVLVDTKGNVRDAIIVKDSGFDVGFEETAVESAFKVKYRPAISNNELVAVWVVYPVRFSLK